MATTDYHSTVKCQHCGGWTVAASAFSLWVRKHPSLESHSQGLSICDTDYIVHKFKTHGSREFQCLMVVEVKCFGAEPSDAQRDSLSAFSQSISNRRTNMHYKKLRRPQCDTGPVRVYSRMIKKYVNCRRFGAHLLQLSGACPDTSTSIRWDGHKITKEQLIGLLRFDLDPDLGLFGRVRPIDFRNHHRKDRDPDLFNRTQAA